MNNIKTIKTFLPVFNGFYNSVFEPESPFERDLESGESDQEILEYYKDLEIDDFDWLKENIFRHTNYGAIQNECAEIITDSLMDLDELDLIKSIKFEKVVSPKYYNFSTDSINVEIEADFNKIADYLKQNLETFKQDRLDRYTSRSGFISHYSNDLDYWLDQENWDSHGLGSVLDFILNNEHSDAVFALYEAANDNYLYEAAISIDWLNETTLKKAYAKHQSNN